MSREPKIKEIADDFGKPHRYTIVPLSASKGLKLLPKILRIVGQVTGALVDAADSGGQQAIEAPTVEDILNPTQQDSVLDASVNGAAITRAFLGLAGELVREGNDALFKEILNGVTRVDDSGEETLVTSSFDVAYQANYGELIVATYHVLDVNFGPCLRARLSTSGILEKMGSLKGLVA